ncbi:energy-coupling factor transporter transmembrane component T family protein [Amaricoccus macauensis]|uniref:energy-coupling factor transporter transmembrane component T family protein n=1 Tax=Amaricoccus macauensis TaxID=57001 RepID=UPI003C7998B1
MISLTSDVPSIYQRWPASAKMLVLCLVTLILGLAGSLVASLSACASLLALYLVPGPRFLRQGLRMLRPLWIFVAVVMLWHIVSGAIAQGVEISARLVTCVGLANLVTMTTRLDDMLAVTERLLGPLRRFGLETHRLGLAVALVIRFTPVLAEKGGRLVEAWRARSARRPGWRIVGPFALLAIDDAEHVSEALRARGGSG